jgi:hypothetical protein
LVPKWITWLAFISSAIYLLSQAELLATVIPDLLVWDLAGFIGSTLWLIWLIIIGIKFLRTRWNKTVVLLHDKTQFLHHHWWTGGGKTSLLENLATHGYNFIPETARQIMKERLAKGLAPRPDPALLLNRSLNWIGKTLSRIQTYHHYYFLTAHSWTAPACYLIPISTVMKTLGKLTWQTDTTTWYSLLPMERNISNRRRKRPIV